MQLSELGERICVLGPSNSGKSTLATAITRKNKLPIIYLDQLHHLPNTNWEKRPTGEFIALHDAAIAGDRWVIDGNYSICLAQRLRRATGLVLLDVSTVTSLLRYFRRTLFEHNRLGGLEGSQDKIRWEMIHHIAVVAPGNRKKYAMIFKESNLPKIRLSAVSEIKQCCKNWGLHCQLAA